MRRFGAHILVFTVITIVCAIFAFLFLGFLFRLFYEPDPKDAELGLMRFTLRMIFFVSISAFYGMVGCIGAVFSIGQVFRPFSQGLDDVSREKLVLEF